MTQLSNISDMAQAIISIVTHNISSMEDVFEELNVELNDNEVANIFEFHAEGNYDYDRTLLLKTIKEMNLTMIFNNIYHQLLSATNRAENTFIKETLANNLVVEKGDTYDIYTSLNNNKIHVASLDEDFLSEGTNKTDLDYQIEREPLAIIEAFNVIDKIR